MEMENNELGQTAVSHPTDLLITCSNTEVAQLQDTANQQVSTLTEEYHFIDQDGQSIHYEIQALPSATPQMMILTSESENGQVFHVIPSSQSGTAQLIIPHGQIQGFQDPLEHSNEQQQCAGGNAVPENTGSFIIHSSTPVTMSKKTPSRSPVDLFQRPLPPLPSNIPVWARRLRDCERIGDSYRGYCLSEAELRSILALHKQQTQSVWGTRQSPSPAKLATRLMWKSQYVPYDGIPFVNAGSRAIVMECQYGPRRKGTQPKKNGENESVSGQIYKATCPARIYIKKVKKFPIYRVPTDPKIDKKLIRMEQEKAFNMLRKDMDGIDGVLRWYVQLPDQDAHQYHNLETGCFSPSPSPLQQAAEEEEEVLCEENSIQPSRLHSRVAEKIRELVACGIYEVYSVRKQLRKFVERELFKPDEIPERHNVSFFPTVNDLKNHIHEAQRSLGNGELIYDSETIPGAVREFNWTSENGNTLNEMITVTFDSTSQEEQESLIKGENSSSEDVSQNTVQLISSLTSLQPKIFAQLQELQLQPSFTSPDGPTALITLNQPAPSFSSPEGTTAVITVSQTGPGSASCLLNSGGSSQPLVLSHLHSQQNDSNMSSVVTLPDPGNNLVSMGQLVTVEDGAGVAGEVHQILLGEIHSIPIQIVESQPTIVEVNTVDAFGTDDAEKVLKVACEEQLSVEHEKSTECQDPA